MPTPRTEDFWRRSAIALIFSLVALFAPDSASGSTPEVNVRDFGAIPGDGKDDAAAIRGAIAHALAHGIPTLRFEAGRYDLQSNQEGTFREANGAACFLRVNVPKGGLSFEGAVDERGQPATLFMGKSRGEVDQELPTILRFIETKEASVRNIVFDWDPWVYSCGAVTSVEGDRVTVAIRPGHPQIEGMKPYNLGIYDPESKAYVSGRIYTHEGKSTWRRSETDGSMVLEDPRLAERVKTGQWVFWFLSYLTESVNLHAQAVGKLTVNNVWMHSAAGYGVQARNVGEASVEGFRIAPTEGRIATTARDGFRFALPVGGDLRVARSHFEGVQDDCQSVYSTHLVVDSVTSPRTLVTRDLRTGTTRSVGVIKGSSWGFYGPEKGLSSFQAGVETFSFAAEANAWTIGFDTDLPAFVGPGTVLCNLSWAPNSYTLTDSTFVNCNAVGSLIQTRNVLISGNTYRNIMEPGVFIGSATYGEGMPVRDIKVMNNRFENCGGVRRYGQDAAVSLGLLADIREHARIERVLIQGNTFKFCKGGGVRVGEAMDVLVEGNNLFDGPTKAAFIVAPESTERVELRENKVRARR